MWQKQCDSAKFGMIVMRVINASLSLLIVIRRYHSMMFVCISNRINRWISNDIGKVQIREHIRR